MIPGTKSRKHDTGFLFFLSVLLGALFWLALSFLQAQKGEHLQYQEIVSLNGITYDEDFLKEIAKLPGIQGISPVLEVPVVLKTGDYSMETALLGVDLEEMALSVSWSKEVRAGSTPVVLAGEKSLDGLADYNNHAMSGKEQQAFLKDDENLDLEYCFAGEAADGRGRFLPLNPAAVLKDPAEFLLIPYWQAEALLRENGMEDEVTKILLTIRGKKNFEQALRYFAPAL